MPTSWRVAVAVAIGALALAAYLARDFDRALYNHLHALLGSPPW
jgi:hypothetical protein